MADDALEAALRQSRSSPTVRGGDGAVEVHAYLRPIPASPHDAAHAWHRTLAAIAALERGYVWHRGLGLGSLRAWRDAGPAHWVAPLRYGDCVLDEWLAVWLMVRVTRESPALVARFHDADDGEVLLVEAADALPPWLVSDEDAAGRVFIHEGRLKVVHPPGLNPDDGPALLPPAGRLLDNKAAFEQALRIVADVSLGARFTRLPDDVHTAVQMRLQQFDDNPVATFALSVRCLVPPTVATILSRHPEFVARSVNAFCDRDAIEMRAAERMSNLGDDTTPMRSESVVVRLSRHMLAKLMAESLGPTKRFAPLPNEKTVEWSQRLVGDRLSIGMELAYLAAKRRVDYESSGTASRESARWRKYLDSLVIRGYFGEEKQGSKRWNDLERLAREKYCSDGRDGNIPVTSSLEEADESEYRYFLDGVSTAMTLNFARCEDQGLATSPTEVKDAVAPSEQPQDPETHGEAPIDTAAVLPDVEDPRESASATTANPFVTGNAVRGFRSFLGGSSSIEGVEAEASAAPDVSLDPDKFMQVAERAFGDSERATNNGDNDSIEDESDEDASESDLGELNESLASFMGELMNRMDQELSLSGLSMSNSVSGAQRGAEPGASGEGIDLDMNLVRNLVNSVNAQGHEPGPASNMLGSMGVPLVRPSARAAKSPHDRTG